MTRLRGEGEISPDFSRIPQISSAQESCKDFLTINYGDLYCFITEGFPTFTELIRTARTHLCNIKHTERAQEKLKRHVAFILTILYRLSMLLYGAETTYRMAKRRKACNV